MASARTALDVSVQAAASAEAVADAYATFFAAAHAAAEGALGADADLAVRALVLLSVL